MCHMPLRDSPWAASGVEWVEENVDWDFVEEDEEEEVTGDDGEWEEEKLEEDTVDFGPPITQNTHVLWFCSPFCRHRFQEENDK